MSGTDTLVKGAHTVWGVTGEWGRYPRQGQGTHTVWGVMGEWGRYPREGRAYSLGRHG